MTALVVTPGLALALIPLRGSQLGLATALLVLLFDVVVVAVAGGMLAALAAAVIAFGFADWYYVTPLHTFQIDHADDLVTLVMFLAIAIVASLVAERLARRNHDATRARSEAEVLARLAATSDLLGPGTMAHLESLKDVFELNAVAILSPIREPEGGWRVDAAAGEPAPTQPSDGDFCAELGDGTVLVAYAPALAPEDRGLLEVFATQLRLARDRIRQQANTASAAVAAESDRLRTAILAAVSHDLRTPLTSIKAAAGSVLSRDVNWSDRAIRAFCEVIDHEADRLDSVIGNLLDMSRIQSGALHPHIEAIGIEEVVDAAIAGIAQNPQDVVVRLEPPAPTVRADRVLLTRALGHLIDNALKWSPARRADIFSEQRGDRIRVCVQDHGPGISPERRPEIFRPFQRLDDGATTQTNGIGLGLAVARGFIEALDGTLEIEETPGGGTTMVIELVVSRPTGTALRSRPMPL